MKNRKRLLKTVGLLTAATVMTVLEGFDVMSKFL